MAVESPPFALQQSSYAAEQTRRAAFAAFSGAGGAIGNSSGQIAAGSGMTVTITAGPLMVPGSLSSTQGLYYMLVTAFDTEAVAASDPTNPRIDRVVATVDDATYSGSANDDKLQVLTGTPTAGANLINLSGAPALPANSLHLGYVLVPAGATSVNAADIFANAAIATSGIAPSSVGRSQAYTPVWSSSGTAPTLGNGSCSGQYARIGPLVYFTASLACGSTSTGGSGDYQLSLPVAAGVPSGLVPQLVPATWQSVGPLGEPLVQGVAEIAAGGSSFSIYFTQESLPTMELWSAIFPATFATTDSVSVSGCYLAA